MKVWDPVKQEVVELSQEEARRFLARNPGIRTIEQKWHALTQIHRHPNEFFGLLKEELEREGGDAPAGDGATDPAKPDGGPPGKEPGPAGK